MTESKILEFYVPCSEWHLSRKLDELPKYGWGSEDLDAMRQVWEQIKNAGREGVTVNAQALENAMRHEIIKYYSSRFWFEPFEGQCDLPLSEPFRPYPSVPPLYGRNRDLRYLRLSNRELHYLWLSSELKEILLQLWLYCKQDEFRFNRAVRTVWDEYSGYSRYECGYGGETTKMAIALKKAADAYQEK